MIGEGPFEEALELTDTRLRSDFWVEAMLPGFFVVDANLDVVNYNQLAVGLLAAAGLATGSYTFRRQSDVSQLPSGLRERTVSITDRLVHEEHHPQLYEFVRLFHAQREMIDAFNKKGTPVHPAELAERFRSVPVAVPDVHVYAYAPQWSPLTGKPLAFRGGVRIAPTAGIKLNIRNDASSADAVPLPNIVDIVCAWRIFCHWHDDQTRIARLTFYGAQPAFHDATARHRLWQDAQNQLRAEAEANLTRLWSHALGTDVRTLNSARDCARDLHMYRDGIDRPQLAESAYLWLEKAFSELNSHVGFLRIVRSLSASRVARAEERRSGTQFATLSGLVASALASALRTLLADREFEPRIHASRRAALAARRAASLDTLLHLSREPDRDQQEQVRDLLVSTGVTMGAWDLDDGATIWAPTQSSERDDEAVTSRALRLLFEEYSYNALKELLKQEKPTLWLETRLVTTGAPVVRVRIANSCPIVDPRSHGTRESEDEKATRDNQKGLFTNYRIFSELFASPTTAYRRDVSAGQFSISLQFPAEAFVVSEKEHG